MIYYVKFIPSLTSFSSAYFYTGHYVPANAASVGWSNGDNTSFAFPQHATHLELSQARFLVARDKPSNKQGEFQIIEVETGKLFVDGPRQLLIDFSPV